MGCCDCLSKQTQYIIELFFHYYGKLSYNYPISLIFIGLIFCILSSIGIIWPNEIKNESNIHHLWSDMNSLPYKNSQNSIKIFGNEPESLELMLTSKILDNGLTTNALNEAYNIYKSIYNITTLYDNNLITYNDICYLDHPTSNKCDSENSNFFPLLYVFLLYILKT